MTIRTLVAAASLAMMLAFNVGHAGAQAVGSETDTFINNLPAPGAGASYIDETGILLGDDVEAGPVPVPYPNSARMAGNEASGLPTDLKKIDAALLPELFAPQPPASAATSHRTHNQTTIEVPVGKSPGLQGGVSLGIGDRLGSPRVQPSGPVPMLRAQHSAPITKLLIDTKHPGSLPSR